MVTLTKHRGLSKPQDEQLHVLPLYVMDNTDEFGSVEGQMLKAQNGSLEILQRYSHQARKRASPVKKPKKGSKKDSPARGGQLPVPTSPVKIPKMKTPPGTPERPVHDQAMFPSPDRTGMSDSDSSMDGFNAQSCGPSEMYEKVWEYFYDNGSFPPESYMNQWAAVQKQAMMNPRRDKQKESPNCQNIDPNMRSNPQNLPTDLRIKTDGSVASQSPFRDGFGTPPMSPNLPRPNSNPSSTQFNCDNSNPASQRPPEMQQSKDGFVAPTLGQGPDEPTFTMMDPTVVSCEWKDSEENFHDPGIGGVAIALCHGAVLFEVAKRELHATTALKNPNRYQPTRISLVFYQHKNLNYHKHGQFEYERKMAQVRKTRIEKLISEGSTEEEATNAVKPGRKRKKKEGEEEEKIDFAKTSAAQYKYMWDTTVRHGLSLTTDSIITRWIDPQPMVTGPYQRWV